MGYLNLLWRLDNMNARPIAEFLKETEKPKYLKLASKTVPKSVDKYGYIMKEQNLLDDELCIVQIKQYDTKLINVMYMDEKGNKSLIVPNEFLASILPPERLAELEDKYKLIKQKHQFKDDFVFSGICGSDPEVFVEDENGQVIPAFKFLGSKEKPNKSTKYFGQQNNLYWDGFQAEFDTHPSSCFSGQADSIHFGLEGVLEYARKYNPKAKLSFRTVMPISEEVMADAKPEHVQFGCMPSLNAYGMKGKDIPGHEVPFRPAGGHMHFGVSNLTAEKAVKAVKSMDAILGVACVSLFANYDNPLRRELYGLAGEYRLPKHGIEYRVLSNAWLIHPLLAHLVFDLGRTAYMVGIKDKLAELWDCPEVETIRIINECDVDAAREVLKKNEHVLKLLIEVKYLRWWTMGEGLSTAKAAEYAYNAFLNGLDSIIEDPRDIEKNWELLTNKWAGHSDGPGKNVMFVFRHKLEDKKV